MTRYEGKSHNHFAWLVAFLSVAALAASYVLYLHAGSSRGMVASKAMRHGFTTFAALLGFVLSLGQAIKAFQKAVDHKNAYGTLSSPVKIAVGDHIYEFHHFWRVGALWVIGALAAASTVLGEVVDFYNDSLEW